MKLQNLFVRSRMNKDLDERLVPKGEYIHAENIRVVDGGSSNIGAIENSQGTDQLTSFELTNAMTIGCYADSFNQKIYYFVTSDEKDMVIEYDDLNSTTTILLETSRPGVLSFSKNYLITGINKIQTGDFNKDLLAWTDNLNPPRIINIERAKTYGLDGFTEEDISVIKNPPLYSPEVIPAYTASTLENNLRERFVGFAYRWKYLDGGYSALSGISYYAFSPGRFLLNYQTMENEGMVNAFNAAQVTFNTGSSRVTDVELVYKESNSTVVYLIERFNKANEGWEDNQEQSYLFSNSKKYSALADDELYRSFDNVPLKAKAQELIGNRLTYGNYLEGRDLEDKFGEKVVPDFNVSLQTRSLAGEPIPYITSGATITLNMAGLTLAKNTRIVLALNLLLSRTTPPTVEGDYEGSTAFILNDDYATVEDLVTSEQFTLFVQEIMTNNLLANYEATPPPDSELYSNTTFTAEAVGDTIVLTLPAFVYRIDNTPLDTEDSDFTDITVQWTAKSSSSFSFKTSAADTSLKTNRSYEGCIVYRDAEGRATPALSAPNNTIYIPQAFSTSQNRMRLTINNKVPEWAKSYRVVVKQNKAEYQTIYVNTFYEDGIFRWIKLEGANLAKVEEGDTLIVKADLGGVVEDVIKVRVIEKAYKEKDFIEGNQNPQGDPIIEEQGWYIKIRPIGFDMSFTENTAKTFEGSAHVRYTGNTYTNPAMGTYDELGVFTPYALNAGSKVRIYINFKAKGSIAYDVTYDRDFIISDDYESVKDWFEDVVEDLGDFGSNYTYNGTGYGFNEDGSSFYVRAHRNGTASRNITTTVRVEVVFSEGIVIFETEPKDSEVDLYYESEEVFLTDDFNHLGNIQNQDAETGVPAIIEIGMFNCYVMGNGAESYRVRDAINAKYLNVDYRPTSTSLNGYSAVRRFADLTYSGTYNEGTSLNGLNEFNLYRGNFKEDIDKRYGSIQKLFARETDLMVFQEDKVSRVLYGKDALMNADGSSNLISIDNVFGDQVDYYSGEYGIGRNPESFAFDASSVYWIDTKRGVPLRMGGNGIIEINYGMSQWFIDELKDALYTKKAGAYDPQSNQYVISTGGANINPAIQLDCSQELIRRHFVGEQIIEVDYGILTGSAGFSMTTNGVPVKYTVIWGDTVVETSGYLGDPSYNEALAALDLPPVEGDGNISFTFEKTSPFPPIIRVILQAPIDGLEFNFAGQCIVAPSLTVVNVVSNDSTFEGLTIDNRYKWVKDGYASGFKHNYVTFNAGDVTLYQPMTGQQGTAYIPSEGSTIIMEAYNGFSETAAFTMGGRMLYLLSDTYYEPEEISDLLLSATPLESTQILLGGGDVINRATFTVPDLSASYLYMIWDYKKLSITPQTRIFIYFDASGSMATTLAPLITMKETILKDRLLPLYNNDSDLYDERVQIIEDWQDEKTLRVLNMATITAGAASETGQTPEGNAIVLVFQDEAYPTYHGVETISPRTASFDADLAVFRGRLNDFPENYYRGVVFQVQGDGTFEDLLRATEEGTSPYNGVNGLSDKEEVIFRYGLEDGASPETYLDAIVEALTSLGYEL